MKIVNRILARILLVGFEVDEGEPQPSLKELRRAWAFFRFIATLDFTTSVVLSEQDFKVEGGIAIVSRDKMKEFQELATRMFK